MPLKDRIAEAIEGSGKSKAEIARDCDVTNSAVTHWLNGETANLKADKALALELATGYRAQWVLNGRGPKRADEPYWPFSSVAASRFAALDPKQQGFVEARLLQAVEECEAAKPPRLVRTLPNAKMRAAQDAVQNLSDDERRNLVSSLRLAEPAEALAGGSDQDAGWLTRARQRKAPSERNNVFGIPDPKNARPARGSRRADQER